MADYCVNKEAQSNGDHEVHTYSCSHLPSESNRKYLGKFDNCHDAVEEARRYYSQVDGCYHCSYACHKS